MQGKSSGSSGMWRRQASPVKENESEASDVAESCMKEAVMVCCKQLSGMLTSPPLGYGFMVTVAFDGRNLTGSYSTQKLGDSQ